MRGITNPQMARYAQFYLQARADVVQLELIEIAHPAFSRSYRVVRNAIEGVSVTLETGEQANFLYYPLKLTFSESRDDLDFGVRVELGDLGELIPAELDAVIQAGAIETKPTVTYRSYRSDDLTRPLFGPVVLEAPAVTSGRDGAAFEAKARSLNVKGSGEAYTFARFPMLRWLL